MSETREINAEFRPEVDSEELSIRPLSLSEFIGQNKLRENLRVFIEAAKSRKEALELLLSDHVGDCEAPCVPSCPANMNIPLMNRLIAEGKFDESLKVVKETIALPLILGYICPAPCEKACRRGQIDDPVSICILKKYVAAEDLREDSYLPEKQVISLEHRHPGAENRPGRY